MGEWSVDKLGVLLKKKKKKKKFSLTQFRGILTIAILKSYRDGSSSNFLFVQEIVKTEVNYFLLHPVV